MVFEVKPWKKPGCAISMPTNKYSDRETYSKEINEEYGEGGGLNANYRTVEAVAKLANILGNAGLIYGEHFVFKTAGLDEIILDFCDEETLQTALPYM